MKIRYYKIDYCRIDISEGIDPTKINKCKACMICHYWFFNHGFKFEDSVCNGCHDLTILNVNISDIAIVTIKNVDYLCIILNIIKSEEINLLKNSVLEDLGYIRNIVLIYSPRKTVSFTYFCFSIYKIVDSEYSMDIYKSENENIRTVTKNLETLKFIPDHLKTKKMYKHAVKNLPFLIR